MTTHDTPVPAAIPTGAVTPSAWWFLAPIGVVAVGMLVAVTIMVAALVSTVNAVVDGGVAVPAQDTARLEVAEAGELVVFVEYATSTGGTLVDPPVVVILGPDGGEVRLVRSGATQSWSSDGTYLVSLGTFTAETAGTYRVVVGPTSGAGTVTEGVVVAPDPLARLAGAFSVAVVVAVVALGVAIVAVVLLLVRRRRSRRGVR